MASELEPDHPCLSVDSLHERDTSPVSGLVHRYHDKALFLATSVCPVYCQYCTRSYAVGQDTALVQKDHVASMHNWNAAFDYICKTTEIEDIVVSDGDVARLKAAQIRLLCKTLLDIPHIRRIRLATKAVSVQPMKFTSDDDWFTAIVEMVQYGRERFKDVCLHTHFNHPNEVTPAVEAAMRRLHAEGVHVRNQSVLLRGVNDDAQTLIELVTGLGRVNIHGYYTYLCDMVMSTEHFRLPLHVAQQLEKEVRGATAGFNTPLFIVDAPGGGGKRDVHSPEFQDAEYGVSVFRAPAVYAHAQYIISIRCARSAPMPAKPGNSPAHGKQSWRAINPPACPANERRPADQHHQVNVILPALQQCFPSCRLKFVLLSRPPPHRAQRRPVWHPW